MATIDCYVRIRKKNDQKSFPITIIGAIDIGFESGVDQSSDCVGVEV